LLFAGSVTQLSSLKSDVLEADGAADREDRIVRGAMHVHMIDDCAAADPAQVERSDPFRPIQHVSAELESNIVKLPARIVVIVPAIAAFRYDE
jgi:hypothetical protein